jgi:hypothetical protein
MEPSCGKDIQDPAGVPIATWKSSEVDRGVTSLKGFEDEVTARRKHTNAKKIENNEALERRSALWYLC